MRSGVESGDTSGDLSSGIVGFLAEDTMPTRFHGRLGRWQPSGWPPGRLLVGARSSAPLCAHPAASA
eukprot:CAMPEP_0170605604 /NCGR_PEP_ID=MMETSP0224-20130122/20060_1 /TAXON_ID=285029 /ORGANISM="Togula jolla, Strain CCCM 725" /LENGTH=66 /DNA_ID=CAMNT_0010930615 /DNA_START=459 /DNA_END=656 /DNA_ORIENTATION=+